MNAAERAGSVGQGRDDAAAEGVPSKPPRPGGASGAPEEIARALDHTVEEMASPKVEA